MRNVVIGFLGTALDAGKRRAWRPSVQLCEHSDFPVDRFEILYDAASTPLAERVRAAIASVSPDTEVLLVPFDLRNPWDFQEVYGKLYDFAQGYGFDEDRERYHVHLTTGTHVAQICWFLLTESRHIPARLLQTSPACGDHAPIGKLDVIDLDLSRYNALQQRFAAASERNSSLLRGGVNSVTPAVNRVIDRLEAIASSTDAPILLHGEAGVGKTALAQRLYELKLQRRRLKGRLTHVVCAGLGAEQTDALFGRRRVNAAGTERSGLLREAYGGAVYLDGVDALSDGTQALLLHAIETGRFYPVGSDSEATSRFHLIASVADDPAALVRSGRLRPDLAARLALWSLRLPPLRERPDDMAANIGYELERADDLLGRKTGFNADAMARYLRFARDPQSRWPGNFRDLSASMLRLCTLAERGRITLAMVDEEVASLRAQWSAAAHDGDAALLAECLPDPTAIDEFERAQLAAVIRACRESKSLSAAGRRLFAASRLEKASRNDADRLRKYLTRFGLDWATISGRIQL